MASVDVIRVYNPVHYNDLLHQHEAARLMWSREEAILPLLSLVQDHGLADSISVCLLHRHMKLTEGERLIYTRASNQNITFATPQVVADDTAVIPTIFQIEMNSDNNPIIKELEFVSCAPDIRPGIQQRLTTFLISTKFIVEFAALARELGVQNLYGVALRTNELLDLQSNELVMEESHDKTDEERILKLYPMDKKFVESSGATQWTLENGLVKQKACIRYCGVCHGRFC